MVCSTRSHLHAALAPGNEADNGWNQGGTRPWLPPSCFRSSVASMYAAVTGCAARFHKRRAVCCLVLCNEFVEGC
jgi:hypothetical protein